MEIKPLNYIELNGEYHIIQETTQTIGEIDSMKTIPIKEFLMKYHLVNIDGVSTTIEAYLEETIARLITERNSIVKSRLGSESTTLL